MRLIILLFFLCSCSPTYIVGVDPRVSDEKVAAISRRINFWNLITKPEYRISFATDTHADVFVREEQPRDLTRSGSYNRTEDLIRVRPGFDMLTFEQVIGHELGHFIIGPDHTSHGVMSNDLSLELSSEDSNMCRKKGPCY